MATTNGSINNKKRIFRSQAQEIIYSVHKFLSEQKEEFNLQHNIVKATAEATGVPRSTVERICRLANAAVDAETSTSNTKNGGQTKIHVSHVVEGIIRRKIHGFYIAKRGCPNVKKVLQELKDEDVANCRKEVLRRKIHEIGFKWVICRNGRKILVEKSDVAARRRRYLLAIKEYRHSNRPIIYVDETCLHATDTISKCLQSDEEIGVGKPISKSKRLIIVHAGGEQGFVKNASLMFRSHTTVGDYRGQMNSENFTKWMEMQVIPNLPPQSVVVMDNAAYHCHQRNKRPNSITLKCKMQEWLTDQNLLFTPEMTKAELLELIKTMPLRKNYMIDELLEKHGHTALRLPPYHPDLNPIELVWGDIKDKVVRKWQGMSMDLGIKKTFLEKCFAEYPVDMWKKWCSHVQDIEKEYLLNDNILDNRIDDIIINTTENSSPDESEEDDDEDYEDD